MVQRALIEIQYLIDRGIESLCWSAERQMIDAKSGDDLAEGAVL
jgi:hypothetical protein